jgi:tyrosine-protein kinase Etk/Wzc
LSKPEFILPTPLAAEGIDFDKLKIIFRKNLIWMVGIIIVCNLSAYLYLRWTKSVFESESELKLDIKQDPSEFGIKNLAEDQNLNIISGEIEQIRSRLFFNRVIDSLDIWASYHFIGKVLNDEMYHRSPFVVEFSNQNHEYLNRPIYFNFKDPSTYVLKFEGGTTAVEGKIGQKLKLGKVDLIVRKTPFYESHHDEDYFFILHSRDYLIRYLQENITVAPLNFNANTIKITFRDFNPQKANHIVNKIDSIYLSYSNELKNQTNRQKISWLNNELAQIEQKMEGYENYFENFTLQNKSSNLGDDLNKTIESLYDLDSQRFQVNRRITEINNVMDQFAADNFYLSINQRNILPAILNRLAEDVQRLGQEKERLNLSYNENTLAYRQKEKDFSLTKQQLFNQLAEYKKALLKTYAELNQQKIRVEKEFAEMPDKNTQFTKNQRFYKLYEEFYLSMMQSRAEFEIAQAGSTPDFKILSPATMPVKPISPIRLMIFSIGFTSGLIISIFFLGFLYLINDKITSIQEIERATKTPILAVIPESRHTTKTPFHVLDNPKSMVSEAIRTLRTNLEFFSTNGHTKTIAISSTIAGEGKSFLALNLGGVIAMSKRKVVLVDLDMRKSKRSSPFEVSDFQKGMSTILINKFSLEECIVPTGLEYFDYIPAGPHPPNPSELLMNNDFDSILEELKTKYEFIIIDTPPIGLVTDGIMAMKKSDVSIYVVRANYSQKEFLNNLQRVKNIHKLSNMSIAFNALPTSTKMYGYGYYEDQTPIKKSWKNIIQG